MLSAGSKIEIKWPQAPSDNGTPLESWILREDKSLLAISKPSGLLIHPLSPCWETAPEASFAGEHTLVSMILSCRPEITASGATRMGLVHRLDRGTSGAMLIAKTPGAQEILLKQFHDRKTEKIYIGAVHGEVKNNTGIIEAPLGRAQGSKRIRVSGVGRQSLTHYKVLSRKRGVSLLELYPKTGRTNQIRVHLAWIGHPVIGDNSYSKMRDSCRLMLHSKKIIFTHPGTGRKTSVEAPIPEDFRDKWLELSGEKI